ncbi:MAG: hypothetical protein ACOYN5_02310, partial [Bacteroidales bacterium]
MKKYLFAGVFFTISVVCFGQLHEGNTINSVGICYQTSHSANESNEIAESLKFTNPVIDGLFAHDEIILSSNLPRRSWKISKVDSGPHTTRFGSEISQMNDNYKSMKQRNNLDVGFQSDSNKNLALEYSGESAPVNPEQSAPV